nr:radical SAM protein [uncultured Holophaga sp.]
MSVLLVMPKGISRSSGYNVFPIGIAYVSAALKAAGLPVHTVNLDYHPSSTREALRELIRAHGVTLVCTSGLSRDFHKVQEVLEVVRELGPGVRSVLGGGIVTSDPATAMHALNPDFGVIGEGERTLCELVEGIASGRDLSSIPGLIYRQEDGQVITTAQRAEIPDIDSIPMPDYEGFAFGRYMEDTGRASAFVVGSRSCPYACTFCFHPSGRTYRQRSIGNLMAEIRHLAERYAPAHLSIHDELFSMDRGRVLEFCREMATLGMPWSPQLRVTDVDREMLQAMRASGCLTISYGLESADDRVLKSMRKQTTLAQIEHALQLTHEMDLDIQGGFIFGDTAETAETARVTLDWAAAHPEYGAELNMIQVFPGTPLYKRACQEGVITDPVQYLKDGCPLINVSSLAPMEFRALASQVYELNMRSKYMPDAVAVRDIQEDRRCTVDYVCRKCGRPHSDAADALLIQRVNCPHCMQRYYLDPFIAAEVDTALVEAALPAGEEVALWGAGDVAIKLLDHYPVFRKEGFLLVDASQSRQGLTLCGKAIHSTELIRSRGIGTVVVAAVNHLESILGTLREQFPEVHTALVPHVRPAGRGFIPELLKVSLVPEPALAPSVG